jgi:DNA (cytosine-5)-methyltransferase 1
VPTIVSKVKVLAPDIIIGGPPCQDFFSAGKRVEDSRATLTEDYAKIVTAVRPRWFVMENVARAQKSTAYTAARAIRTR